MSTAALYASFSSAAWSAAETRKKHGEKSAEYKAARQETESRKALWIASLPAEDEGLLHRDVKPANVLGAAEQGSLFQ